MPNSRIASDGGPLWSRDSIGHYWLMFPNKHALDDQDIREIFSEFGHVKQFTKAGDEKGLRFIQYKTLEETEKAIKGLENHPVVSLRPHRQPKKNKDSKNSKDKDNSADADNKSIKSTAEDNNCKKNTYQRKSTIMDCLSPLEKKEKLNESKKSYNFKNKKSDHSVKFNDCSETPKLSDSTDNSLFKKLQKMLISKTNNSENCNKNESECTNYSNGKLTSLNILDLHKHRVNMINYYEESEKQEEPTYSSDNLNSIFDLDEDDEELPDLVIKEKLEKPKMICLDAGEVIVGNIHKYLGPAYMLHLFANYEPIAVSYMKCVPDTGLRYCHVYFKNPQESKEVEKRFDMYKLAGKNLIVMRPDKLAQKAGLV